MCSLGLSVVSYYLLKNIELFIINYSREIHTPIAAGPESYEDYFQKGALLGKKAALNLWYVDTRPNSQKLFPS